MEKNADFRKLCSFSGFTLIEAVTTSFIALYIILAAWSVYVMGWSWWREAAPQVEAQRIARIALSVIRDGTVDSTAGNYSIGINSYKRRNGISQATAVPAIPSPQRINYRLETEASNARAFFLANDAASGLNVVYYRDPGGADHRIDSTLGITDLTFTDVSGGSGNLIYVAATVERDIVGTRTEPRHIEVVYGDVIYLRNVPG